MISLRELPNQLPNEHVIASLRKHPISLMGIIFATALLFLVYPSAYFLAQASGVVLEPGSPFFSVLVLVGSAFFLYAWLFLYQAFLDYYLDIWVITNFRILNIEQTGLFSRRISEIRLYRIQDATATVSGALHTLLNYGKVEIQSAGENPHFVFEDIPDPNGVTKTILHLAEEDRKSAVGSALEDLSMTHEKWQKPEKKTSR